MDKIPDILTSLSGCQIDNMKDWEQFRRKEILNLFEEYVYGVRDIERPENLFFRIKEEREQYGMFTKTIEIGFENFSFPVTLYLPKALKKPVPTFVFVSHEYIDREYTMSEDGNLILEGTNKQVPFKAITDRGFGIAFMPTRNIYRDWDAKADFKHGVFNAVRHPMGRKENAWATISAWAWGASRVMDYLETDSDVDCENIAVMGHSRGGKTALWASATDTRFKLAISNNSGCMGAALLRGKVGEHIKDINITDWFCENFHAFNEREELLPVDQHMLLALIAPRYVYVMSSSLDEWADPEAEFKSCQLAGEAFRLYDGADGLIMPHEKPEIGETYHEGHIAYHLKDGEHSLVRYDWECVMDYFSKIINDGEQTDD